MQNLAGFIPPRAINVVEIGCTDGITAAQFKQIQPQCHFVGINNKAINNVEFLDQTEQENFTDLYFMKHGIKNIDCIVYHSDYVEISNMKERLIDQLKSLNDDGQVLFTLENIGYYRNIVSLWQGKSSLNNTKFTLEQLLQVLQSIGLKIDNIYPQYDDNDIAEQKDTLVQNLIKSFVEYCQSRKEPLPAQMWAKKFIIRAVKPQMVKPRMLLQTMLGEQSTCARVRILEPHNFICTDFGIDSVSKHLTADINISDHYAEKILIRQRMRFIDVNNLIDLKDKILPKGYAVIYETDDSPELWDKAHAQTCYADFSCCHAVQVSTPTLKKYMQQYNPNVIVFQNQLRTLPPKRAYNDNEPITIFFGAINRERDWQDIMPILNEALHRYKDKIFVKVMYDKKFFDELQTKNKQFWSGVCSYDIYQQVLHTADISLLPLLDTSFNRMKSDLKFIESAGHGAVVLASPTVYSETVKDGRTGFIYQHKKDFRKKLFALIEDSEERHIIAKAAYEYVRDNRMLAQHYQERSRYYRQIVSDLPALNKQLMQRIKLKEQEIKDKNK